jgi:hypothetical protein
MPRFACVLAALLSVGLSLSRGQESRYVPIPFQGNFETLFKERLQGAKDNLPFRDLLNRLKQNPNRYDLDSSLLKHLDDPALKETLKGIMEKHPRGREFTPSELEPLKKALKNITAAAGGTSSAPPVRNDIGDVPLSNAPRQGPAQFPKPRSQTVDRWLRDLARDAENTPLGDWLQNSPAFQKGLGDLRTLVNLEKSPYLSGLVNLPEHLRIPDKLNLGVGDGIIKGLQNITLPEMPHVNLPNVNLPHINLPHISLGRWNLPAAPLPNLGGSGGARFGEALLWTAVVVALVILVWHIAKNHGQRGQRLSSVAILGPWPVDPAEVATRQQLIMAFDYLALLLLGMQARTWNHRAIASRIGTATHHADAALELALLYERARYTVGADPLSAGDQAIVRRDLVLLAGVPVS